jgi:hypothetical protein
VLGNSSQSWAGTPLPIRLSGSGAAACNLYVSVDAVATAAAAGNGLVLPLPVPANAALLGTDAFLQGAAFDTGPNPGGVAFSNGLAAHFGSR